MSYRVIWVFCVIVAVCGMVGAMVTGVYAYLTHNVLTILDVSSKWVSMGTIGVSIVLGLPAILFLFLGFRINSGIAYIPDDVLDELDGVDWIVYSFIALAALYLVLNLIMVSSGYAIIEIVRRMGLM